MMVRDEAALCFLFCSLFDVCVVCYLTALYVSRVEVDFAHRVS